jgi:hypothetical protein
MTAVSVHIARRDGESLVVEGAQVAEHFAVHRHPGAEDFQPWQATHLPTGLPLPGRFWAAEHATRYAEAVAALPGDWSTPDGAKAAAKEHAPRAFDLRRQLEEESRKAWCNSPLPEWPTCEADATADRMARYYAMTAQAAHLRSGEVHAEHVERGEPGYDKHLADTWNASSMFVTEWAVLRLLRALAEHAPEAADEVAADLWSALEYGDMGESLWEWLVVDYRIDPDAIAERRRQHQEERQRKKAEAQATAAAEPTGTPA